MGALRFPLLDKITGKLNPAVVPDLSGSYVAAQVASTKTASYAVTGPEVVRMDATGGARTVTLPTSPANGMRVTVKKTDTSANAVTVVCGGSDVLNKVGGATSASLALVNQALTLQYDYAAAIWTVVADDLPLSGLDGRFAPVGVQSITDATFKAALAALLAVRDMLNILDYGVSTGTSSSQTAAIKTALDANPGKSFYFPPGNYRLDTTLSITKDNSLIGTLDARIYAGAAMATLIDYDNGLTVSNYSPDKAIRGCTLDGALNAGAVLAVGSVLRFTLADLTIIDGINRGLLLKSAGAEVIGRNLRIYNSGTTNAGSSPSVTTTSGSAAITGTFALTDAGSPIVGAGISVGTTLLSVTDTTHATMSANATASATVTAAILNNIAIEANMGDCQFSDVIIRDCTVGVWDKASNVWNDVHPWIGTTTQLTARYPNSVGFLIAGNSVLNQPYADTFRYSIRTAIASGFSKVQVLAPKVFCNTGNLTDPLAAASPGVVFDLQDGAQLVAVAGKYQGHGTTHHAFTSGSTIRLTVPSYIDLVPGSITGIAEYKRGVQLGTFNISPTFYSHVTGLGSVVYTTRAGTMEVRDGTVTYTGRIVGTQGSDATGNYRLGNLTFPVGPTTVSLGVGSLSRRAGVTTAVGLYGANGTSGNLIAIVYDASGNEIAVTANQAFDIHFTISCPFTYPS